MRAWASRMTCLMTSSGTSTPSRSCMHIGRWREMTGDEGVGVEDDLLDDLVRHVDTLPLMHAHREMEGDDGR